MGGSCDHFDVISKSPYPQGRLVCFFTIMNIPTFQSCVKYVLIKAISSTTGVEVSAACEWTGRSVKGMQRQAPLCRTSQFSLASRSPGRFIRGQ